jgi:hypothetical protein
VRGSAESDIQCADDVTMTRAMEGRRELYWIVFAVLVPRLSVRSSLKGFNRR